MSRINFFEEDVVYRLPKPRKTAGWIKSIIKQEQRELQEINFIFCSDDHLHRMNIQYLNHDTLTDIVTFDNTEGSNSIEADIYVSIDRVRENALIFKKSFSEELHRVLIHGVLHLLGFKDKSAQEKKRMRETEDACLSLPSVPRETF